MNECFIEMFEKYKNDVYRLAYSYTGNRNDADDVTQNVFIKLYKKCNDIDEKIIKKWLTKVTINECKTLFLSSWYKRIKPLNEEECIVYNYKSNEMLDSIMNLDKKYRIVIFLYYYEGYKISEISQILKINENTVKTHLMRAKLQLKNIIKDDFDE